MTTRAHPEVDRITGRIVEACESGRFIDDLPAPGVMGIDMAYAIQKRVFCQRSPAGATAAGWFASATNHEMRRQLGLEEPYAARWRPGRFVSAPEATLALGPFGAAIELEISFVIGRDLSPQSEPFATAQILDAIDTVHPSVELVISCFRDWIDQKPLSLIAEGGTEQFLLLGEPVEDWRALDLAEVPVSLTVDGEVRCTGSGARVMDGPLSVMHWLAGHVARRGEGLRAGQICNTGMCAPVHFVRPGENLVADFGPLGRIALTIDAETVPMTQAPRLGVSRNSRGEEK